MISCALLLVLLQSVHSHYSFDAFRAIQLDKNSMQFGSRRTAVNHQLTPLPENILAVPLPTTEELQETVAASASAKKGALSRQMVIVPIAELSVKRFNLLLEDGASSLLILLPKDLNNLTTEQTAVWEAVESFILNNKFEIPIYFSYDNEDMVEVAKVGPESTDRYQAVVSGPEATAASSVLMYNFQGWLHGAPAGAGHEGPSSTIALVANYDTFAAAPGLAFGMSGSGSSTVALLELARMFNRLYSDFRTHGSKNLVFVLTTGSSMNQAGSKHWLRAVDSRVLESIEFALCIDSLALLNNNNLYLHINKSPQNPEVRPLYDDFENTAKAMGIDFELRHDRINISDSRVHWQHEQFSRKRIVSATLSGRREFSKASSGLLDTKARVDEAVLTKNIKFIAEVLAKQLYKTIDPFSADVFEESRSANQNSVAHWISFLSQHHRVNSKFTKGNAVADRLEQALVQYTTEAKRVAFPADSSYQFYTTPTRSLLNIYSVKPFSFDLYFMGGVVAYLVLLHVFLKAAFGSISDIFFLKK